MATSVRSLSGEARGAIVAVLGAAVLFGTSGTARELGPDDASALAVGAVRISIGTVVLWLMVLGERARGGAQVRVLGGGTRRWSLILLGAAGVAVYTPLFFVAVDRVGVALGTVVTIASGPFFTGAIEATLLRRPPSRVWLVGTSITALGAALLVSSGDGAGGQADALGIAAALASGLGYAVYSVTAKASIEDGLSSTLALAAPFTVGAAVVVALASTQSFAWLATAQGVVMALYLGIFATGFAYVLFGLGLRRLTPSTTVTLVLAEPITASLLAVIVLDEMIAVVGWVGITVVVAGLWLVGRDVALNPSADPPIASNEGEPALR
ncbi:MAG: EamA family transporter [Acidimicrobiia bacterium]|nr:EamA family transporter [Acidimicrobiia bacterium]